MDSSRIFRRRYAQQLAELKAHPPQVAPGGDVRDLRSLLWSSIDNDTSRDLDQIEVAERLPNGDIKVMVGIADVDAFVTKILRSTNMRRKKPRPSIRACEFSRCCRKSFRPARLRFWKTPTSLSVVIEFTVDAAGSVSSSNVYRAIVRNQAQLTYNAVGGWLEGTGPAPAKVAASADLQAQLKLQDEAAQALKNQRYRNGALNLETSEVRPVLLNQQVVDIEKQQKNHATDLIEDFMIAANGVVARMLEKVSSLRRIVKTPERWDRIVQLAAAHGGNLPPDPDSKALNDFLLKRKACRPGSLCRLSLAVIKLIGPGEYVLERPGDPEQGHFGLAVQDYTHSTAPNRRFADVVTQRLIKAMLANQPCSVFR